MPTRPGRTCAEPRCPNVVTDPNTSRCRIHDLRYQLELDKRRPGARARGYNRSWDETRRLFLEVNPRCVMCGARATDVDHIRPKSAGGTDEWGNLRSLCHSCHSSRTGRDQGSFARRNL